MKKYKVYKKRQIKQSLSLQKRQNRYKTIVRVNGITQRSKQQFLESFEKSNSRFKDCNFSEPKFISRKISQEDKFFHKQKSNSNKDIKTSNLSKIFKMPFSTKNNRDLQETITKILSPNTQIVIQEKCLRSHKLLHKMNRLKKKQKKINREVNDFQQISSIDSLKYKEKQRAFQNLNFKKSFHRNISYRSKQDENNQNYLNDGLQSLIDYFKIRQQNEQSNQIQPTKLKLLNNSLQYFMKCKTGAKCRSPFICLLMGLCYTELNNLNQAFKNLHNFYQQNNNFFQILKFQLIKEDLFISKIFEKIIIEAYIFLAQSYNQLSLYKQSLQTLYRCQKYTKRLLFSKILAIKQKKNFCEPRTSRFITNSNKNLLFNNKKRLYLTIQSRQTESLKKYRKDTIQQGKQRQRYRMNTIQESKQKQTLSNDHLNIKYFFQKIFQSNSQVVKWNKQEIQQYFYKIYLVRAQTYFRSNNVKKAISVCRDLVEISNISIQVILQLSRLLYINQQVNQSLSLLVDTEQNVLNNKAFCNKIAVVRDLNFQRFLINFYEDQYFDCQEILKKIAIEQYQSQIYFYQGLISLSKRHRQQMQQNYDYKLEQALNYFQKSISYFNSAYYALNSFYFKILILIIDKNDYYGAEAEFNKFERLFINNGVQIQNILKYNTTNYFTIFDAMVIKRNRSDKLWYLRIRKQSFQLLKHLVEAVILIFKKKFKLGVSILKQIQFEISEQKIFTKQISFYVTSIKTIIYQFIYYGLSCMRFFSQSLPYLKKVLICQNLLKSISLDIKNKKNKCTLINKIMIESMQMLEKQNNLEKIQQQQQLEDYLKSNQYDFLVSLDSKIYIQNTFKLIKSIYHINTYNKKLKHQQSQHQTHLLQANQLLESIVEIQKQSYAGFYLLSVIQYQLKNYRQSMEYLLKAMQFSDEHMIKHYFLKACIKFKEKKYQDAIKGFTNVLIVQKQVFKNFEKKQNKIDQQQYYCEIQQKIQNIYLCRAIANIKYYCSKSQIGDCDNQVLVQYKLNAKNDLCFYFQQDLKINKQSQQRIKNQLKLFMYTQSPTQIIKIIEQKLQLKNILNYKQIYHLYYLQRQLDKAIEYLEKYICQKKQQLAKKNTKEHLNISQIEYQNLRQDEFDHQCLKALQLFCSNFQVQRPLQLLLNLAENVYIQYQRIEQQLIDSEISFEQKVSCYCGEIFTWSDLIFFIGLMYYENESYEMAIRYFYQSLKFKQQSQKLRTLKRLHNKKNFQNLCYLFQNQIYHKQEILYNIGICYFLVQNYEKAYQLLKQYSQFEQIIYYHLHQQNKIDRNSSSNQSLISFTFQQLKNDQLIISSINSLDSSFLVNLQPLTQQKLKQQNQNNDQNFISPFPLQNRFCSFLSPVKYNNNYIYLSFCLPKLCLPFFSSLENNNLNSSKTKDQKSDSKAKQQKMKIQHINDYFNIIQRISSKDLQVRLIAPWIKHNEKGVIFTQNLVNESIDVSLFSYEQTSVI